ncbi:tetratricopeptide repeat protein [Phenylobacterium sp.]|uniref:tetratricopeptide repeat protein n=1 Tax=Phenylobacterium sp. TaxID=1871053 RepID=UPI0025E91977|nr:tetratricopeptide repeat protein [Phenylobacterium sp.]
MAEAIAAHRANDFEAAERGNKALPERPAARRNLGALYFAFGRLDQAEAAFRSALELTPGDAATEHNLSFVLLAQGRHAAGWALYERRRDNPASDIAGRTCRVRNGGAKPWPAAGSWSSASRASATTSCSPGSCRCWRRKAPR